MARELGLPLPRDFMRCGDQRPHKAHWHPITTRVTQNTAAPNETEYKWCDGKKPKKRDRAEYESEDY
jgi:hypothetical protein